MTLYDLVNMKLEPADFTESTRYLIDDFLAENSITMFFANGGEGKSLFSLALAKSLSQQYSNKKIFYVDFDNPKGVLKARNVENITKEFNNFYYIHRSKYSGDGYSFLIDISSKNSSLEDCIFFFDSLRDFIDGDIGNDSKMRRTMEMFKILRDRGATVNLLHHTTKNGESFQGSVDLRNSIDNVYRLRKGISNHKYIYFPLTVNKERNSISNAGFALDPNKNELKQTSYLFASISNFEYQIIKKAFLCMKQDVQITQKDFLEKMGFEKDDKTAREALKKFTNILWTTQNGKQNRIFYTPMIKALKETYEVMT